MEKFRFKALVSHSSDANWLKVPSLDLERFTRSSVSSCTWHSVRSFDKMPFAFVDLSDKSELGLGLEIVVAVVAFSAEGIVDVASDKDDANIIFLL